MGLRDIEIEDEYRSDQCPDLGIYFISNLLTQSIIYKRAVGFFSSSALIKISRGISALAVKPNAHIYLVASPYLSKEDVEAIKKGYELRKTIIQRSLLSQITEPKDKYEAERLNYLCHLIEKGILDIKIADRISDSVMGMFHEKIGVFEDSSGNKVAFTGSLNESDNAFSQNFESIQVFKSWEEEKRTLIVENNFERLWEDKTHSLHVYDFPDAVKTSLFRFKKPTCVEDPDAYEREDRLKENITNDLPGIYLPFELHQYQKDAINKWAKQGYRGLFDMGTGTGKTITALSAAVSLLKKANYKMATIVVCPYTHLVEQWVEEEKNFHIKFIVGYSSSKYNGYRTQLQQAVQDYNDGIINYFFFVTTNASYKTEDVQKILHSIKKKVLFIADEVHNFGAEGLRQCFIDAFKYRIGLSATIDRHRDENGTAAIYEYFGDPVIHYGLKEALDAGVLTRYFYYPITVSLTSDEVDRYLELSEKIRKNSYPQKNGSVKLTKAGEMYAMQRARLIAVASNKIQTLKKHITPFKDKNNLLIYCGTGKISNSENGEEIKQIQKVCDLLGNELGMKIARYTAEEDAEKRKSITQRYKEDDLQAVVAIKCLDEGVNIPSIETAFILASSTNPREYIQRRGRVLRKFEGKTYSYIYDFVTLPYEYNDLDSINPDFLKSFRPMIKNEINRLKEFSSLAENEHESDELISYLTEIFGLNTLEFNDDYDKINWEAINYGE